MVLNSVHFLINYQKKKTIEFPLKEKYAIHFEIWKLNGSPKKNLIFSQRLQNVNFFLRKKYETFSTHFHTNQTEPNKNHHSLPHGLHPHLQRNELTCPFINSSLFQVTLSFQLIFNTRPAITLIGSSENSATFLSLLHFLSLMVQEMRFDMNPFSLHKHNHTFVKCALCFVLMGLAVRLWFSDSIRFSSAVDSVEIPPEGKTESLAPEEQKTESLEDSLPIQTPVSVDFPGNDNQTSQKGEPFFSHFLFLSSSHA